MVESMGAINLLEAPWGGPCSGLMKSPADFLARIRGICIGAEDGAGEFCFGDFPHYLQVQLPDYANESCLVAFTRMFDGKGLIEAIIELRKHVLEWKRSPHTPPICRRSKATGVVDPDMWENVWCKWKPGAFYHAPAWGWNIDVDTFQLMQAVLRSPEDYVPGCSTFREVLVCLDGICLSRRSPHGSIAGIGTYGKIERSYFQWKPETPWGRVALLSELESRPLAEACAEISVVIDRTLEIALAFYFTDDPCPACQEGLVGFRKCSNLTTIVMVCDRCAAVWLQPDAITTEAAIRRLSGNDFVDGFDCSIGISAGAQWASMAEIIDAGLERFVAGNYRRLGPG